MKHSDTEMQVSSSIRWKQLFQGTPGQDGAIYGDLLFRFNSDGSCKVFSMSTQEQISAFLLDKTDVICPHSNAVCFGTEKWEESDEFPLLYTNIYNNYSSAEHRLVGVCCVYRLTRIGNEFSTTLVQVIRVGFVDNLALYKSRPGRGDVSPYGNFIIDVPKNRMYVLTMRDEEPSTRCLEFDVPSARDGVYYDKWGVRVVTLNPNDIRAKFDFEYSNFLQGACCCDGLIYSLEGFDAKTPNDPNMPVLRVIDVQKQEQIAKIDFFTVGLNIEPELIDFMDDRLIYMDVIGRVYEIEFC